MAKLIKTDGTITEVKPAKGKTFLLEELQGFVGGSIEIVGLSGKLGLMCLNENGKLDGLPYNSVADALFQYRRGSGDFIVGDVLVGTEQEID